MKAKFVITPLLMLALGLSSCGVPASNTSIPVETPTASEEPTPITPTSKPIPAPTKTTITPTPTITPSQTSESSVPPSSEPTPTSTPSPTEEQESPLIEQKPQVMYTITKLNVRNGPGTDFKLIDYLEKGDKITIDATKENWSRLEGTDLWVSTGYLNSKKPVDPTVQQEEKQKAQLSKFASKYGCSSAIIILNDPRLGEVSNAKADWGANSILFRSTAPADRWEYLIAHECAHLRQYSIYGGNIKKLESDMNKVYGGVNYEGLEQNADCFVFMANPKNTDYHYTRQCTNERGKVAQSILKNEKPQINTKKP